MNVAAVAGHMCCVCAKARTKRKHHFVTLPSALRVSRCSCAHALRVRVFAAKQPRAAMTNMHLKHAPCPLCACSACRALPAAPSKRTVQRPRQCIRPGCAGIIRMPRRLAAAQLGGAPSCGNAIHLSWAGSPAAPHPPRSGRHPSPHWACINHDRARPCCNKFGALTYDFFLTFQKKNNDLPCMMRCGI